jgi:hypothetical protein
VRNVAFYHSHNLIALVWVYQNYDFVVTHCQLLTVYTAPFKRMKQGVTICNALNKS